MASKLWHPSLSDSVQVTGGWKGGVREGTGSRFGFFFGSATFDWPDKATGGGWCQRRSEEELISGGASPSRAGPPQTLHPAAGGRRSRQSKNSQRQVNSSQILEWPNGQTSRLKLYNPTRPFSNKTHQQLHQLNNKHFQQDLFTWTLFIWLWWACSTISSGFSTQAEISLSRVHLKVFLVI